ncbi:MAG: amino acid permease [Phycisphaerae bacterium]|nr:amino acid permease [Phycisphaerae bacterium]
MTKAVFSADELPRRIGFWSASAVMVGIIIGSGIFRTPGEIAKHLGQPWLILGLWLLGGLISLAGALTYAELAVRFPRSGGVYVFLREGYGPCVAFVFGWTYMLITKPFAAAGIAVIFGENLIVASGVALDEGSRRVVTNLVTSLILTVLTVVNTIGVGPGTGLAKALTALKLAALIAIISVPFAAGAVSTANFRSEPVSEPLWKALVAVMSMILWTYDGWSDVGSLAGEVTEPQRRLPSIYSVGTIAVTVLYAGVNVAYFAVLPLGDMRGVPSVAALVLERAVGPAGAIAITWIVIVSTLGSTHGSILTGARITFAQARDGLLFRVLGRVSSRFQTPAVALWAQLVLSILALWFGGDFGQLAETFTFTMWIFYGLAAFTIFRFRVPGAVDPGAYRCPGYPVVPLAFIGTSVLMTILSIADDPWRTGLWLGVLAAGVPVYCGWHWWARRDES